ncbi:MAG: peptidylprolyl isomerase [Candidatus Omnitrophica bacterium]|nr:peptidylprolyl isomerase [Candidatus Omnitrophota bacterium]
MKINFTVRYFFTAILAVSVLMPVSSASALDTVDRILVVVNDDIITDSDLNAVLGPLSERLKATVTGPELETKLREAQTFILRQMIDDRLITSAAREKNIQVEESEIDKMVDEMRGKFPSEEAFNRVMQQQGMSFKELRERFKVDILKQRMIDFKVRSRISVSPGDIRDYYDAHPEEFDAMPRAKVRQILIRTGTVRTEIEAKQIIQSLVSKIEAGENFADVAGEFSEDSESENKGDMGWVEKNQFMERIDSAIFKLKPGEMSEVIKTQLGFHVFKLEDFEKSAPKPFEEVQYKIEHIIYKQKVNTLMSEWLDELRNNAYISFQR